MSEGVRLVNRVFDIIEVLATHKQGITLSQIADMAAMSKSTVHRLLSTMCARQYVERNEDGSYTLGYKFIETASNHINNLELITEAKPLLSRMLWDLNLTTHLGVLEGPNVVYMEKMDVYPNTRLYTQVGYRSPAFCSSMGKCLLACLSGEELDKVLDCCDFKKYTPHTIVDRDELKEHLKKIRVSGWAMDNEEYQLGHRCIGAPVFDYRGCAVAAISASGPTTQLMDDKIETVRREVKSAARRLSRRMGFAES
jgi:IclR family KDG regulon transcriptional repressor